MSKKIIASLSLIGFVMVTTTQANQAEQDLEKELNKNTAAILTSGAGSLNQLGGLIDQFLPEFEVSGFAGDENQPLSIERNIQLGRFGRDAKVQVVFNRGSEVLPDIRAMLSDEKATQFAAELNDTDDFELNFSYEFLGKKLGRNAAPHLKDFNDIYNKYVSEDQTLQDAKEKTNQAKRALECIIVDRSAIKSDNYCEDGARLMSQIDSTTVEFGGEDYCSKLVGLDNANVEMRDVCTELGKAVATETTTRNALAKRSNISTFGELLNNQPELQLKASYRDRDELIGPDELSIRLSYKFGSVNLNSLRRQVPIQSLALMTDQDAINGNLKRYESLASKAKKLRSSGQFIASIEYTDIDDHVFNRDELSFFRAGGQRLTGSLMYGLPISYNAADDVRTRFDLTAQLELPLGSTPGDDRLVATGVLTYKVNNSFSIPLTIQYANRSEFLNDDNDQVFANIGFKYDFSFKE